jgi:hypothetical protein
MAQLSAQREKESDPAKREALWQEMNRVRREGVEQEHAFAWKLIAGVSAIAVAPVVIAVSGEAAAAIALRAFVMAGNSARLAALLPMAGPFLAGLVDPNPAGSVDFPGPFDDAGRAAKHVVGGAAESVVGRLTTMSPELEKELISDAPKMIDEAMRTLEKLGIDTSLMRVKAATQSQLEAFAEATGKEAENIAAYYSPRRSGDTVKFEDLFSTAIDSDAESAVVNVALSTLEAARKDPSILVSALTHEAHELTKFYDAFVEAGGTLSKSKFAALEREFHAEALKAEAAVLKLLGK